MIDLLKYYYNMNVNDYIENKEIIYFNYNYKKYYLTTIATSKMNIIIKSQNYPYFNKIISNRFNEAFTFYSNKIYAVFEILFDYYRSIELRDIKNIININKNNYITTDIIDYSKLWNRKINYYNNIYQNRKNYYFEYFMGIGRCAYLLSRNINYNNINYGFSINRIKKNNDICEFWNPAILKYGASVNILSEYIKCRFFDFDEEISKDIIDEFELNNDEYKLLISKLLFPTYYLDLINCDENNKDNEQIEKVIDKIEKYIKYVFGLMQ